MKRNCLSDEELLELYYQEDCDDSARHHLSCCPDCQQSFYQLCNDLIDLELPIPDAGYRAVQEILETIEKQIDESHKDEVMTPEEVADWFKVSPHNIYNMLHQIPYFVIDGKIRFTRKALQSFLDSQYSNADKKAPDQLASNIIPLSGRKAG